MWPVGSLEYLRVQVRALVNGNAVYNPTTDAVSFGFVPQGGGNNAGTEPTPQQLYAGSWETTTITGQTAYVARCLVGPGGTFVPTANTTYFVWLKVQDSPEVPLKFCGTLQVT